MQKISIVFLIWLFNESNGSTEMRDRPRDVGAPCEWEGVKGTCINYWTCATNAVDSSHGKSAPMCPTEGNDVLTCCTSCKVVANFSTSFISGNYVFEKTGKKSNDKCLDYLKMYGKLYNCYDEAYGVGNITKTLTLGQNCYSLGTNYNRGVGGEDALRSEYPHMALLGYGENWESAQWNCGGSVISEWYILTAGHCRTNPDLGDVQFVALGILKRSDPPSLWQVYHVDTFIPHPEYKRPSKYNDIALIRTDKRIEFSNAVLPACLPRGDETEEDMETAVATGWGRLGHKKNLADVLRKVKLTRFTSEQCSEQYGPHRSLKQGFHNITQMCYGDNITGKDTCEGDGGGPLQIDQKMICPHIVIGVISAGRACGSVGALGLYTRVANYQSWIEGIVWP